MNRPHQQIPRIRASFIFLDNLSDTYHFIGFNLKTIMDQGLGYFY